MMRISHIWLMENFSDKNLICWFDRIFGKHAEVEVTTVLRELKHDMCDNWFSLINYEWHKHLEEKPKG